MYVLVHMCMYTCMHISLDVYVSAYMYVCMCISLHICKSMCIPIYVCVDIYRYICMYMSICILICIHVYGCMYMNIYLRMCMYMCACVCNFTSPAIGWVLRIPPPSHVGCKWFLLSRLGNSAGPPMILSTIEGLIAIDGVWRLTTAGGRPVCC